MSAKVYVKNMVCPRCISAVKALLDNLDIPFLSVRLGEINLPEPISDLKSTEFSKELENLGFALVSDRKSRLIAQMKKLVIDKIHYSKDPVPYKWADLVSDALKLDYKYLSALFSSVESITFEQYIINQKIERVKELMIYDELNLSEISYQLNYSSVAYLSNQFRKIMGMTPTQFKSSQLQNRKALDAI